MDHLHRRTLRALALALAAVWVVTLAFADTAVTPAMHCQRGHMPCCPPSSNESCSTARCAEQIPEKAEAQAAQTPEDESQAAVLPTPPPGAKRFAPEAVPQLTAGLRFQAAVFRLKDDLRI